MSKTKSTESLDSFGLKIKRPDTGTLPDAPSALETPLESSMVSMNETIAKYPTHHSGKAILESSRALVDDEEDQPKQLLSGAKLAMAIISLDILMFISALDTTIVATTYVPIGNKLGALDTAEWIITSYLITTTAFQPLYGKISDLLGRVETIVFAIVMFLIGSILCAVSKSMGMLIASRAIQGIGGAGLMSLALIVIADIMNERQRGKYVGIFTGTYGVASAIAPVIGGVIVQNTKWQVIFWINIPFCVVALVMIVMLLRIPRPKGSVREKIKRIDFVGSLLCLAGVTLFLLALTWGGREHSWGSAQVVCPLVIGVALLAVFVVYEWKVPLVPIVPVSMFKIRNVVFACLVNLFFGFAINGTIMFIPQWALIVKNASAVTAGAYLVPCCIGMIITSIASGVLVSKTGRSREIVIVGAAMFTLGNGLLIILTSDGKLGNIIGFLLLSGLGMGSCIQVINLIGQASVEGKDMASATTTFMFFRSLGQVLAVSVLSNIIQNMLLDQVALLVDQFPSYAKLLYGVLKDQALLYSSGVPEALQSGFIAAYNSALKDGFIALTAFTGLYFLLTFGFKHVELKTVLKKTIDS
ncbi:hypothetical protein IW150_000732 [Coemansia sp. RSA 2607]|nr:hypothetical protein IW150_000732 [Coemansia sp. RSA 2607]